MKGPYERLKYDLRRVWECPQCQARQRTDGTITGLVCNCQYPVVENERVSMKLVRDDIRRSSVKQPTSSPPTSDTPTSDTPTSDTPERSASAESAGQPVPPAGQSVDPEKEDAPSQGESNSENSADHETTNDHDGPE